MQTPNVQWLFCFFPFVILFLLNFSYIFQVRSLSIINRCYYSAYILLPYPLRSSKISARTPARTRTITYFENKKKKTKRKSMKAWKKKKFRLHCFPTRHFSITENKMLFSPLPFAVLAVLAMLAVLALHCCGWLKKKNWKMKNEKGKIFLWEMKWLPIQSRNKWQSPLFSAMHSE